MAMLLVGPSPALAAGLAALEDGSYTSGPFLAVGVGDPAVPRGGSGLRWTGSSFGEGFCPSVPVAFTRTGAGDGSGEWVVALEAHAENARVTADIVVTAFQAPDASDVFAPAFFLRSFKTFCYAHLWCCTRETEISGTGVLFKEPLPLTT